jgi:FkbM family methyltransferase
MALVDLALRFRHTGIAGKLIRAPLGLIPKNQALPIPTGINRGMRWIIGAGPNHGCWFGSYEADRISALPKIIRRMMVCYDLGANAGFYTLALSRLVGPQGCVFAFEPEATNAHYLRRHVKMNHLKNVTVAQLAVSSGTGVVGFEEEASSASGSIVQKSRYLVPSISLDEFIAQGNPPPHFLKMDIEGAEVEALKGAKILLSKSRPIISLATHSEELSYQCREILSGHRYKFKAFDCKTPAHPWWDCLAFPE